MLFSYQPHFIKDAVSDGIIAMYSASVEHNELERLTENEHSGMGTNVTTILAALFSVVVMWTVCGGLCVFCRRRKTKTAKKMREYDAFLCGSGDEWDTARVTLMVMEEKYHLKLFFNERDSMPGLTMTKNLENAVENSNCAIVILSIGFFYSNWCQQVLQRCLIEHQEDPSFQVFVIFTEKKKLLKTHLKKSFLLSGDSREYVRFMFSNERCLDFNDCGLHEKLFRKIRNNRSKPRSMRQRQPDEEALLKDDVSSDEYQNRPDPRSALEGRPSSVPSYGDSSIDQRPLAFLEDINDTYFEEYQTFSSEENQNPDCGESEISSDVQEQTNSDDQQTVQNDEASRFGNR